MTTIIAYRNQTDTVMYADTKGCYAEQIDLTVGSKIFRLNDCLVGYAGDGLAFRLLSQFKALHATEGILDYLSEHTHRSDSETSPDITFLVAFKDIFYLVCSGGYTPIEEEFCAIGSGAPFAYGAYEMLRVVRPGEQFHGGHMGRIVGVCSKRDPHTGSSCECYCMEEA